MVRDSGQVCATAVPSIAGGFVRVSVAGLMAAWRACRGGPAGMGGFRAWLALHEVRARRCTVPADRAGGLAVAELASILGVTPRRAKAAASRLVAAGLVRLDGPRPEFPDQDLGDAAVADSIGGGRGWLAIPRRMLRHLAAGSSPATIATALGVLLRCLSRRRAGWEGRGRLKASWVAGAFQVDLRRVKLARGELVGLGWIEPEPWGQRIENRWGRAYRIDLGWSAPRRPATPLPAARWSIPATPSSDPDPLQEEKDQEPGSAGVSLKEDQQTGLPERKVVQQTPRLDGGRPGSGSCASDAHNCRCLPPPRLADIRPADLAETDRLLDLHAQAVEAGLVETSEADRLRFVAAAEHARVVGKTNVPGLFAHLVRGKLWRYLTAEDEDRAVARLKAHRRGQDGAGWVSPPPRPTVAGPSDGEVVRAVRLALARAGFLRDAWPVFASRNPGWSRERWDRAVSEMR